MPAFITKFTIYLRESIQELKKVTWPTRPEVIQDTAAVMAVSLAVALLIGAIDYIFNLGLEKLIQF